MDKPIPLDDGSKAGSSRSTSGSQGGVTAKTPTASSAARPIIGPTAKKTEGKVISTDKIAGVKTFLAKLHIGSIDFVDQQINDWLKDNPGITIKRTNTATGMVTGKTTEPHIIVTVWY